MSSFSLKRGFDLTGRKFGLLTVLCKTNEFIVNSDSTNISGKKKTYLWRCKCECGREILYRPNKLLQGRRTSCGCCRRVKLDGIVFDSYAEASYYLELRKSGKKFDCHGHYPNSTLKYDFFIESDNEYVEITSFNKSYGRWDVYLKKIEFKRNLVEKVLGGKFKFIQRDVSLTKSELEEITREMQPNGKRPEIFRPKRVYRRYSNINWNLSDFEISKQKGITEKQVVAVRKKYFPELIKKIHWDLANWELSNGQIAKDLSCTINAVRNKRKKLESNLK